MDRLSIVCRLLLHVAALLAPVDGRGLRPADYEAAPLGSGAERNADLHRLDGRSRLSPLLGRAAKHRPQGADPAHPPQRLPARYAGAGAVRPHAARLQQPCIRIANPVGLAELVLRGQARWDRAAIDSAMAGDRTIHVHVDDPMAVFILYVTAVAAADGTVHFSPDLYRHDAALARALERAKVADDRGPAAPDGDDRTRTL